MVPKRPHTMADNDRYVRVKQVAECLFPFFGLVLCTHPIVL